MEYSIELPPILSTEAPTYAPTLSPVKSSVQLSVMLVFLVLILMIITCSCCMSKEWCCLNKCLQDWLACLICQRACKKKETTDDRDTNSLVRMFSFVRPIGAKGSSLYVLQFQLGLLLWKRYIEVTRNVGGTVLFFFLPSVGLLVMLLLYATFADPVFSNAHSSGTIEVLASPMLFIVTVQLTTSSLVVEKGQRLKEAMRMMGLKEAPYWISYIISDALVLGFLLSFLLTFLSSIMQLYHNLGAGYNGDGHQDILGFFLLLFLSTFAMTTMAFSISALFDTPQTASMVSFTIILASIVMFIVFLVSSPQFFDTDTKQTLWCLFPPMALQMGVMTKFTIKTGFFYLLNKKIKSSTDLPTVYRMLILDCFIYSFLAWYLGQVMPSEVGVRKHPLFLISPSYWKEVCKGLMEKLKTRNSFTALSQPLNDEDEEANMQGLSYPCEADLLNRHPTVKVRNLVKKFGNFTAIDGLGFDMYENEIFALLGHNGAGKTTTLHILTGMFPPTTPTLGEQQQQQGDGSTVAKIYDVDIFDNLEGARNCLGVCPQHDVLFDSLTAREHITFFSLLKGKKDTFEEATQDADELLNHFHLQERSNHLGSELSGGMKRKLSTAIALCGGSKFVVLDEPTAGMDPLARRELWDLLKSMRKGRTMLLTTHYMDEADVLGDRVGIMSRGKLRCLGSPTFLKKEFGSGYKLCCTMGTALTQLSNQASSQDDDSNALTVSSPAAATSGGASGGDSEESWASAPFLSPDKGSQASQPQTEQATQMVVQNNGSSSSSSSSFSEINTGAMVKNNGFTNHTRSNLQNHPMVEKISEFIVKYIPKADFVTNESSSFSIVFVFPFDSIGSFGTFFENFDSHLKYLKVTGYGLTITSLEEVFLKVGGDEDLVGDMASGRGGIAGGRGANSLSKDIVINEGGGSTGSGEYVPLGDVEADVNHYLLFTQVLALWRKRVTYALNDMVKFLPTILLPTAAITTAFVLNALNVYGSQFRPGGLNSNLITALICTAGAIPVVALLVEHVVSERVSKLRNVLTVMGCDVKSYWIGTLTGDMTILILSVISATIAAGVCARLKPEDVVNDDHVLSRLDDDEPLADWFNVKLPIALFLFTYQICNFSYFCSFWFPSAKMAIAFMPFFCLVLIMGAGAFTGMAIFGLGRNGFELIQPDQSDIVGSMLWLIAVVSPHGALCMALLHIGDICRDVSPDVCVVPPYSWSCLLMAAEGSLYLYMTYRIDLKNFLAIEAKPNPANTPERLARMRNKIDENVRKENEAVLEMEEFEIERQAQPFIGANGDTIYRDAVNPVLGATVRTAVYLDEGSGLLDPYSLRVAGLRKLYPPKKPGEKALAAVENLSLRIPRGEVFGLLGANGAGKTTAISMIMRSTYPNFGDIHIEGYSVLKDFKMAAKHLGVVTQHNTLWDRLSCKDHLKLFAQIRGVPPHEVDEMVQRTIIELELGPYQNKLAMQLSGGMKRKLCVAVALIGDPKLVLLDEPSAGLDPVSRRNLWDTLIRTMASRAVVLTTHSMEEAEALCTRIGIMVKGQLRALGTPQELKIQLGVGYEIALKVHQLHDTPSTIQAGEADEGGGQKPANDHESLANILKSKFPSICEISNNGGLVTYSIPAAEMNVGVAFSMLEQMRSDLGGFDYAIAQPTLEQVFVSTVIAHSGEERKAKTIDNSTSASTRYNPSSMSNKSSVTTLVASHTSKQQQSQQSHNNTNDSNHLSIDQASNNDNGVSYHNKNNHQTTIAEVGGLGERDSIFDDEDLDTGIPGTWCGLNKRSHRFMAIAAGFLAWLGYQTIFRARVGYVFLPFLISFVASVIGCAGCCCLIPSDPDEETDKE